jgi:hypothetical protein
MRRRVQTVRSWRTLRRRGGRQAARFLRTATVVVVAVVLALVVLMATVIMMAMRLVRRRCSSCRG